MHSQLTSSTNTGQNGLLEIMLASSMRSRCWWIVPWTSCWVWAILVEHRLTSSINDCKSQRQTAPLCSVQCERWTQASVYLGYVYTGTNPIPDRRADMQSPPRWRIMVSWAVHLYCRCPWSTGCSPVRLSTVGSRAFPVVAAEIWNSLPEHIISAPTLQSGRHLKTFLLQFFCL